MSEAGSEEFSGVRVGSFLLWTLEFGRRPVGWARDTDPVGCTVSVAGGGASKTSICCWSEVASFSCWLWSRRAVVVYSDSMSCLQAIEGEDTENPLICHIMNLLWALSDKDTRVRFCWVPSHCGIEGNEILDQLANETLDHDIDPLATVHYADLKPVVNSYIQQEVQIKWDVSIHGRDLYLLKPTLGPPKKFKHLTRAEEFVITRLRIGHTKATKSHILSRGPPTACQHCGQTLTIEHVLLECTVLQQICDEYYTADSLETLFETIPETCIVEFLREAGLFYLIWKAIYPVPHIIRITHQLAKFDIYINHHILTPLDSFNLFI